MRERQSFESMLLWRIMTGVREGVHDALVEVLKEVNIEKIIKETAREYFENQKSLVENK